MTRQSRPASVISHQAIASAQSRSQLEEDACLIQASSLETTITAAVASSSFGDAISGREAARILGIAPKTLRNWRSAGRGPTYVKYGGRHGPVRYDVEALLAWRRAHTRETASGGARHA
jgi:hypothetical protein